MSDFTREQETFLLAAVRDYLEAVVASGKSRAEIHERYDDQRRELIEEKLKPLLDDYFKGSVELPEFKRKIAVINRAKKIQIEGIENRLWGFSGFGGQRFFNMLVTSAKSAEECDCELKSALSLPENDEEAAAKLRKFRAYAVRVRETQNKRLYLWSVPFFVSYFWQIRKRNIWPVYFPNSVRVIERMNMNLWHKTKTGDFGQDYRSFKRLHEGINELVKKELFELVSKVLRRPFTHYDVEHVLWFKGGNDVSK
jgi:hypothetical protein